MKRKLTRNIIR